MEQSDQIQARFPHCRVVEKPDLFSHVADTETPFYCSGIQQGRPADGTLAAGEQVALHSNEDPLRPWIITKDGVVAQVQGQLRSIPL
jgi:hypothetical protein